MDVWSSRRICRKHVAALMSTENESRQSCTNSVSLKPPGVELCIDWNAAVLLLPMNIISFKFGMPLTASGLLFSHVCSRRRCLFSLLGPFMTSCVVLVWTSRSTLQPRVLKASPHGSRGKKMVGCLEWQDLFYPGSSVSVAWNGTIFRFCSILGLMERQP